MAKKKLIDSRAKKAELQAELKRIENEIDTSINEVKHAAADNFGLPSLVKKYPLQSVAASLILGLIAGQAGRKSKEPVRKSRTTGKDNSVRNLLTQEIKRLLVKRGVSLLSEKLDAQLSSRTEKQDAANTGE